MTSLFDAREFNERLFFPRSDTTEPPPGAVDQLVNGWHVRRHAGPAPTLLLFHGNGEVVADYDDAAHGFAQAGVTLAVADFPGYGKSTGTPTLRGIIAGAPAVFDAVKPEVVMGRSLGSACANELMGRGANARFILESGFVDLFGLLKRRGLTAPAAFTDDERATFDPVPKLQRSKQRLLVLHGEDDALISAAEARRAFEAAGTAEKQLVLIEGRGHNDVSISPSYWRAIAEFVAAK